MGMGLAGEIVTDTDGNEYKAVRIGNQVWMAENLRTTKDKAGNPIPLIEKKSEWAALEETNTYKAYCFYENDGSYGYGALYTYAAAMDACPAGWHLPNDEEWMTLESYLKENGHDEITAKVLKARTGWAEDGNGTDDFGFAALPGGFRSDNGNFNSSGVMGYWWSSTETQDIYAWHRYISHRYDVLSRYGMGKSAGYSVRCVKDK